MTDASIPAPAGAAPTQWFVIFQRRTATWWVERFCPGEFKHVMVVGWVPHSGTWIWFNPTLGGLELLVLVDGLEAWAKIAGQMEDAVVVQMVARLPVAGQRPRIPLGAWCVPLVANAVNVRSGAVTPSGLLRDCLATDGSVVVPNAAIDPC